MFTKEKTAVKESYLTLFGNRGARFTKIHMPLESSQIKVSRMQNKRVRATLLIDSLMYNITNNRINTVLNRLDSDKSYFKDDRVSVFQYAPLLQIGNISFN